MPTTTTTDDWTFSASINGMNFNKPTSTSMGLGVGAAATAVSGETQCTGVGYASLASSRSGANNTAVGYGTLNNATTAHSNTAIGAGTLLNNVAGTDATAVGFMALYSNTGSRSTAVGSYALQDSTTATQQSSEAFGYAALANQTTGFWNVGVGMRSLYTLTTQTSNIAMGYESLYTTNGAANVGLGHMALRVCTGSNNIGIGYQVLKGVTSGSSNIGIGYEAGINITTGSTNITIGHDIDAVSATASNQLNIGNTIYGDLSSKKIGIGTPAPATNLHIYSTSIPILRIHHDTDSSPTPLIQLMRGVNDTFGADAYTDWQIQNEGGFFKLQYNDSSAGSLQTPFTISYNGNVGINDSSPSYKLEVAGTFYASGSSIEYKQEVEEYIPPEGALMSLKPIQYKYKDAWKDFGKRYAGNSSRQLGFVAEDVAKILPELAVTKTEDGEEVVRNVDYEKLTVLLVSEVQNLRKEINELKINNQIGV